MDMARSHRGARRWAEEPVPAGRPGAAGASFHARSPGNSGRHRVHGRCLLEVPCRSWEPLSVRYLGVGPGVPASAWRRRPHFSSLPCSFGCSSEKDPAGGSRWGACEGRQWPRGKRPRSWSDAPCSWTAGPQRRASRAAPRVLRREPQTAPGECEPRSRSRERRGKSRPRARVPAAPPPHHTHLNSL